jgi:hypothetical protein
MPTSGIFNVPRFRFQIRHFMIFVAAAALMIAALRFDEQNTCTPLSPVLAGSYLCMWLSGWGAHARGRRVRTGVLVGLLLGPLGVIWAWSNPVPEKYLVAKRERSGACTRQSTESTSD